MNTKIINLQKIIKELGYKQVLLENDCFIELIIYKASEDKSMIYGISYNKCDSNNIFDVGNIAIESDKKSHLGFFTIVKKVNEKSIISALRIVDESIAFINNGFINYYDSSEIDKVIREYAASYDYIVN